MPPTRLFRAAWSITTLAILVLPGYALAQDDASSGTDAPDAWQDAFDVAAGPLTGRLQPTAGDGADWYRLDAGPDAVIIVHWSLTGNGAGAVLELRADNGTLLQRNQPTSPDITTFRSPVRIGVVVASNGTASDAIPYDIRLTTSPRPDLAPSQPRLSSTGPFPGLAPFPLAHRVSFDVTNLGRGHARAADLQVDVVHVSPLSSCTETLLRATISIAPGESSRFETTWDHVGEVGKAYLVVRANHPWDMNRLNDAVSVSWNPLPLDTPGADPLCTLGA